MKVAIIGSGLAAVSASKALVKRGIKPILLDVGQQIEKEKKTLVEKMSKIEPIAWNSLDRNAITDNPTIRGNAVPKKLLYGSNYFYGTSTNNARIEGTGPMPPFSYAKGGFSAGWGAAVLPPDDCDLDGWPIKNKELSRYYKEVLDDIPYSACNDELAENFPLFSDKYSPLQLTVGNKNLLQDLRNSGLYSKNELVYGQSRLLTRALDSENREGCKYCGYCMSGCVYNCIYKSSTDIELMVSKNEIEYKNNILVHTLEQIDNKVNILFINRDKKNEILVFDRVFLAAGAVNSTRIILNSNNLYNNKIILKSRAGFIAPIFRLKKTPIDWPYINTQPGIFLEYKVHKLSNYWVHAQLSTPNEIIYKKLNINLKQNNIYQNIKKRLVEHLVIAFCNMHSDYSHSYELFLKKENNLSGNKLIYNRQINNKSDRAIKHALIKLFSIGRNIGCYPLLPFVKNNSGSYHVGGSLSMKIKPSKITDTNIFGNPMNMDRVHVIDSSIFPSIPGTTIGLIIMANATRIASQVNLD